MEDQFKEIREYYSNELNRYNRETGIFFDQYKATRDRDCEILYQQIVALQEQQQEEQEEEEQEQEEQEEEEQEEQEEEEQEEQEIVDLAWEQFLDNCTRWYNYDKGGAKKAIPKYIDSTIPTKRLPKTGKQLEWRKEYIELNPTLNDLFQE